MADTDALIERLREAIPKLSSHQARTVGWLLDHTALLREAADALAALTRERDEQARLADSSFGKAEQYLQAAKVSAEIEAKAVARAEAAEAALAQAREALGHISQIAQSRRVGGPSMDGTEHFSSPGFMQIRDIARAALTGEAG